MQKDKSQSLTDCKSTDELIELFDACDFGDYLDAMPEADFEVDLKRKRHQHCDQK